MKRLLTLLLFALLIMLSATAYAWETPTIDEPAKWHYEDDERCISIWQMSVGDAVCYIADVQISDVSLFRTELDSKTATTSKLATKANAVFAINGDDYGTHKYGVIIRNGELLRTHNTTRNMLIVDANGDMSVKIDRNGEDYVALGQQLISENVWQTFEFGPELVRNGEAVTFSKEFDVISTKAGRLEPRTAIGQIGKLHYLVIVVDGRQRSYSVGMSLTDLQDLFIKYGAQTAMNLDGGGSSEMWFQGEVLNQPSGGKERKISDIICF